MVEIVTGLWLCSWKDAKRVNKELDDPFVINCTKELGYLTKNTLRIPIDDNQFDVPALTSCIFDVCGVIEEKLSLGYPVIVHGLGGRQRSAMVVVCYLAIYHRATIGDPVAFVESLKPDVFVPYRTFDETLRSVRATVGGGGGDDDDDPAICPFLGF